MASIEAAQKFSWPISAPRPAHAELAPFDEPALPGPWEHELTTRLQGACRGALVRGRPNSQGYNEIFAEPSDRGKVLFPLGWIRFQDTPGPPGAAAGPPRSIAAVLAMPAKQLPESEQLSGSFWRMTHVSGSYQPRKHVVLQATDYQNSHPVQPPAPALLNAISDVPFLVQRHRVRDDLSLSPQMECNSIEAAENEPLPMTAFTGALQALKALHERDLIHRDVSAENLLMKDGIAHLADLDELTFMTQIPGFAGKRDYLDSATLEAVEDGNALEHVSRFGKTNDNYAMLLTMLAAMFPSDSAFDAARWLEKANHGSDTPLSLFDPKTKEKAFTDGYSIKLKQLANWLHQNVRPDHLTAVALLLESPTRYHARMGDKRPLCDMLDC